MPFFAHFMSNARPKTNLNKVSRWVFRYVGDKTFDFSSKKRIFCPKRPNLAQKLAFLVNLDQAMQAFSVPCWWVGWWLWRDGCISQDAYLLYTIAEVVFQIDCLPQIELAFAYGCEHDVRSSTLVQYIRQSGVQNALRISRLSML